MVSIAPEMQESLKPRNLDLRALSYSSGGAGGGVRWKTSGQLIGNVTTVHISFLLGNPYFLCSSLQKIVMEEI